MTDKDAPPPYEGEKTVPIEPHTEQSQVQYVEEPPSAAQPPRAPDVHIPRYNNPYLDNIKRFNAGYDQPGQQGDTYPYSSAYPGPINTTTIVTTQPSVFVAPVGGRPSDLLVPAILVCLCCCCPLGIYAIVYASKANSSADAGNYVQAESSNRTARVLIMISLVLGLIWSAIFFALVVTRTQAADYGGRY